MSLTCRRASTTITTNGTTETLTVVAPVTRTLTQTLTSLTATLSLSYLTIDTTIPIAENSSFVIFVRYWYYDPNSTVAISALNSTMLQVWGGNYFGSVSVTNPNFTITEISPSLPIIIGGPNNHSKASIL